MVTIERRALLVTIGKQFNMTWTFREGATKTELEIAFWWYDGMVKFLKTNDSWQKQDLGEFIRQLESNVLYTGFIDGVFSGLVQGEEKSKDVVEGHLFTNVDDLDFLTMLITYAKNRALTKYQYVVTQTPVKHKTMLGLNLRAGFYDSAIKSWSSVHKGRLVTIQHNIASR